MRHNRATPSPCPTPARREFLAGLVGVTAAAGVTVAAAASADPDAELLALVDDLRRATAEVDRTADEWFDATTRARAAYPPELPRFTDWAEANHPRGPFLKPGAKDSAGRAVLVGLLRGLPSQNVDWAGRDGEMIAEAMIEAEAEYREEVRPAYDALLVERAVIIGKINVRERIAALLAENEAAEAWQKRAVAAVLSCRPSTARGFVAKSLALLGRTGDPEEDGQNVGTLIEDAEALVAQGAA